MTGGRVDEWQADEQLLAVLHGAASRDDDKTYLNTLLELNLVMPADPGRDEWAVASIDEAGTVVVVFTSVEAMRSSPAGDGVSYVVLPVLDLLHSWPDPEWSLLVDGALDSQVLVKASAIAELRAAAAEAYPLDASLRAAAGHPRSYLTALVSAEVVVPMRPKGSPTRDLSNPGFAWWNTEDADEAPAVLLFSSPVRLQGSLGDVPWLLAPFTEVLRYWPDGCAAVIDPHHHTGMSLPAEAITGMAVVLHER